MDFTNTKCYYDVRIILKDKFVAGKTLWYIAMLKFRDMNLWRSVAGEKWWNKCMPSSYAYWSSGLIQQRFPDVLNYIFLAHCRYNSVTSDMLVWSHTSTLSCVLLIYLFFCKQFRNSPNEWLHPNGICNLLILLSRQELKLDGVQNAPAQVPHITWQNHGSIYYEFSKDSPPQMMIKPGNLKQQVEKS